MHVRSKYMFRSMLNACFCFLKVQINHCYHFYIRARRCIYMYLESNLLFFQILKKKAILCTASSALSAEKD